MTTQSRPPTRIFPNSSGRPSITHGSLLPFIAEGNTQTLVDYTLAFGYGQVAHLTRILLRKKRHPSNVRGERIGVATLCGTWLLGEWVCVVGEGGYKWQVRRRASGWAFPCGSVGTRSHPGRLNRLMLAVAASARVSTAILSDVAALSPGLRTPPLPVTHAWVRMLQNSSYKCMLS